MKRFGVLSFAAAGVLALGMAACGGDDENGGASASTDGGGELSGSIAIDGSSTVAPLSEPMGALFQEQNPNVAVTVGTSGTGGGFEKFCRGETDISDASRKIDDEEVALCEQNGVTPIEIPVANDALSVVVNPDNPVTCLTIEQLQAIYSPDATATNWSEIEGLEPPFDASLEIFSPGADSGTFDYFTDAVNDEEGAQRSEDVNVVGEDDNATVTGVSGSEGGVGYFGYSFFNENQDKLKALEIENPDTGECVAPTEETTQSGDYAPLGRQLYIYPSAQSLEKPAVKAFVEYYLDNVNDVIPQAGFIGLTEQQIDASRQALTAAESGGGTATTGAAAE